MACIDLGHVRNSLAARQPSLCKPSVTHSKYVEAVFWLMQHVLLSDIDLGLYSCLSLKVLNEFVSPILFCCLVVLSSIQFDPVRLDYVPSSNPWLLSMG